MNHPLRVEPLSNPMHVLANLTARNHASKIFATPVSGKCIYSDILLSIKFDPFIVTVYLRRGRFGGMSRRDWRIFLLSWLIGNAWWSVVCFTGLSTAKLVSWFDWSGETGG